MRGFSGINHFNQQRRCLASIARFVGSTSFQVDPTEALRCNSHQLNPCTSSSKIDFTPNRRHLSTNNQLGILWGCSSYEVILRKLEVALENGSADEAWEAFNNYKSLHGFPKHQLVNRVIVILSGSSDRDWLHKAYDLVILILDEKPHLLHPESLTRLALTLSRAQMPVPASSVLRVVLESFKIPSTDTLNILFAHLVKTQNGTYLASEILIEICEYCLLKKSDWKSMKQMKLIKPSVVMFNLVLNSCIRFRSMLKAQQIIELMSQVGVVADANTIVVIARIYEIVGQRDELKSLQRHIDDVSSEVLKRHYQHFYDSLLTLHFKYNDLDAAADLVLDLFQQRSSILIPKKSFGGSSGLQEQCLFQIGSSNLKMGSTIVVDPTRLQKDLILDALGHSGLVVYADGMLIPTNKAFSKLINGFVKERKVNQLSNLLITIQKEESNKASFLADVIDACIQLGWLETAHDILDDLESAAISVRASTYALLLDAYRRENKLDESKSLLKQMRKVGCGDYPPDRGATPSNDYSSLVGFLEREIKDGGRASPMNYEFNNSILFFCKAKMMDDALKTLKRMQERNIQPTVQTFGYLVNGYSSLKMYRQITILWGQIRRRLEDRVLTVDRDLFDCLMCNFLRGGYFERVMEIVNYMLKHNMFTDRWKYKREFLKIHKDLYKSLKASDARTDAQRKRLEYVRAFRRWVGIDCK